MPIYIVIRLERCWMQALSASEQKSGVDGWIGYPLDCYHYWSKGGANNQECFHKVDKQTERSQSECFLLIVGYFQQVDK